jgi:hypothetical protein
MHAMLNLLPIHAASSNSPPDLGLVALPDCTSQVSSVSAQGSVSGSMLSGDEYDMQV